MIQHFQYTVAELVPFIDWVYFFHAWQVKEHTEQGAELKADALRMLTSLADDIGAKALYWEVKAHSEEDNIIIEAPDSKHQTIVIPLLRQQMLGADGYALCLADFIRPDKDTLGLFATTCALKANANADPYESLMMQTLATRLAEAAAEKVDEDTWNKKNQNDVNKGKTDYKGIRPAVGYPSLPDLSINFLLDELLDMGDIGITLTENGAMAPPSSVSGLIIRHPSARYFNIGTISNEQFEDYTRRRGLPPQRMRQFLRAVLD